MLVVSRKPGEKVVIGSDIVVTIIEAKGNRVRIGISVPEDVPVFRGELVETASKPPAQDHPGRELVLQS
jgi:carbon storage regulator